ncbi:acyl-CoA dehydrogenase family protein [Catenulispora pinisilvae]|uniref:acyl-CoA dehydrogenase family protein n=1 Tax=Catenulispora pinisilvae TaxID=2705253 RepID=UPI0018924F7E|nr:acyl-CoA dehydrogenase family protein [Catenulispora pinisilvae]
MDFRPTQDQLALAGAVRDVLGKHPAPGTPGQDGPEPGVGGVAGALWRDLAELGIFGVRVPEADGGLGLGHPESVHVFEELGRSLATGPFTATALAATLLPEYAAGRHRVGLGDLTGGAPQLLEHLDALDALLVIEIVDGETPGVAGHSQVLRVEPIELRADAVPHPVDPRVPLHRLRQKPLRGEIVGDAGTADALLREGALLTAAYQVGIAAVLTERAVAYAKQRTQFGRAIGSFQAVKHLCADMFARAELARAAVHSAAVQLADEAVGSDGADLPAAAAAVSAAKLLADDAAVANARAAIQVHGGMGCTWEMGLHFYLKRAWALSLAYGRAAEHADLISESL